MEESNFKMIYLSVISGTYALTKGQNSVFIKSVVYLPDIGQSEKLIQKMQN